MTWDDLLEPGFFRDVIHALVPGSSPSEVQVRAIREMDLLGSRRNLLVSSTTNSGKTLIGYLALLQSVLRGRRALLMVPLRALAQEKYAELIALSKALKGSEFSVEVTTGDYRLNEETMQSPPPEGGQLVIATPERIEAILRNADYDPWIRSIAIVVCDEAHLIGDPVRGASLEYVITSLKILRGPPRFVLLSATMGDTQNIEEWLRPCDSVVSEVRFPPLARSILFLEEGEDVKEAVRDQVLEVFKDPDASILIFVYQTAAADSLAKYLQEHLSDQTGERGVRAYHSRMSAKQRESVRSCFLERSSRCVVSTTALAMGVNLPATHVLLRDMSRGPAGKLRSDELVQISGRAGRGLLPGHALFMVKPSDRWEESELVEALEISSLPEIRSTLIPAARNGFDRSAKEPPLARCVLSLLARQAEDGIRDDSLKRFVGATFEGSTALDGLDVGLSYLSAPSRLFAYDVGEAWKATALGKAVSKNSISMEVGSGIAQLVRDLLIVDEEDRMLQRFGKLDLLILLELVGEGITTRLRFSEKLADQVDGFMQASPEKSVLFNEWIRGKDGFSKAEEIMGSLSVDLKGSAKVASCPRKRAYVATARAIILWQRANGMRVEDVVRRWKVEDLGGVEEKWRDGRLFMLGACTGIWDVRCFFYHLREDCDANDERVLRVKRVFQRLRVHTYQLLDLISWCSPLGKVMLRLRSQMAGSGKSLPAKATLEKIEGSGVKTIADLKKMTLEQYADIGVRPSFSKIIQAYLRRLS
ncbi:DEAD/DEAH box helicase [Coraliomargarita sp. W4R53]